MSAAATAAGYLYASGRLRGRNGREDENNNPQEHGDKPRPKRKEVKVAVYEPAAPMAPAPSAPVAPRPKTMPKIQYRTRRWKPE